MRDSPVKKAYDAHRGLFAVVAAVILVTVVQSLYIGIPLEEFNELGLVIGGAVMQFCATMAVLGMIAFARCGFSWDALKKRAEVYFSSETFCFGLLGAIILVTAATLFIYQKCFVYVLNPFDYWDPVFAKWDKAVHFGHYPHEFFIAAVNKYPFLAKVMDEAYLLWLGALTLTGIYCLYCDNNFRRRMHFMWTYAITFILVGSAAAIVFSSAGPVFFHDFFPSIEDPYQGFIAHLALMDEKYDLRIVSGRHYLLDWTLSKRVIDPNSIAAMPSMHNATMLFTALYLRTVNRYAFGAACIMVVMIFFSSIYTGFHYAIDAYAGYAMVIAIWFLTKKLINRLYPGTENMVLTR